MVWRGMPIVLLALLGAVPADAGEVSPGRLTQHMSCVLVRYYVAKYTAPAAESWARSKGATDAEIEAARQCLTVRTAAK